VHAPTERKLVRRLRHRPQLCRLQLGNGGSGSEGREREDAEKGEPASAPEKESKESLALMQADWHGAVRELESLGAAPTFRGKLDALLRCKDQIAVQMEKRGVSAA
jgi:hypothetical protein